MSKIEWTEKTWNPIVGCSVTSPGCKNCYAMEMAGRLEAMNAKTGNTPQYAGTTQKVKGKSVWTGKIGTASNVVWTEPLRRKTPTMYFVNSMGDLFHPDVPDDLLMRAFSIMAESPQHTFQILTKHPENMHRVLKENYYGYGSISRMQAGLYQLAEGYWIGSPYPLPNVWLGVSVEDQKRADERIPILLKTPAAVRFISAEPLLGPIDLDLAVASARSASGQTLSGYADGLDGVIVGGESGRGARRMYPDWARSLRNQCARSGTPFFFKQWGKIVPHNQMSGDSKAPDDVCSNLAPSLDPKTLDGVRHLELPEFGAG